MSIEWEIEELAYLAMGKTEEEADIDEAIYERYEIDFEVYCEIVKDLLPFTQPVTTAIGETKSFAFIDNEQKRIICRLDV